MKIGIIGGGMMGCSLAYYLARAGAKVTLFEKEFQLGGLAASGLVEGRSLEKYHHVFFKNDTQISELVKEIGLKNVLKWDGGKIGSFVGQQLYSLSSLSDVLFRYKPLSFKERGYFIFNMLKISMLPLSVKEERNLDAMPAADWVKEIFGGEDSENMFGVLLKKKFGERFQEVPALWLYHRLKRRLSSKKMFGGESIGCMALEVQGFFEKLKDVVEFNKGQVALSQPVEKIFTSQGRVEGLCVKGKSFQCDKVISTVPTP